MRLEIRPSGKRYAVAAVIRGEAIPLSAEGLPFERARDMACEAALSGPFRGWPVIRREPQKEDSFVRVRSCLWGLA
ncbi:MAG TPA: hypothetical protein VNK48_14510 [Xanthobacteraceae bacterium]|nr:hypothetical protein [Xanthobacteraceae bacterium]